MTRLSRGPKIWNSVNEWYAQSRRWIKEPPIDGRAFMSPNYAKAGEPNTWRMKYKVGMTPLYPGAHLALEVPLTWKMDLGRMFPANIVNIAVPRGNYGPGWAPYIEVNISKKTVKTNLRISYLNRFNIIDVVILEGSLEQEDWIEIVLGSETASLLRAQPYAQKAIFALGIDKQGRGIYHRPREMPYVKVVGNVARDLRVVAPATVTIGKSFEVTLQAVDQYNENPATRYGGKVHLYSSLKDLSLPTTHIFYKGKATSKVSSCKMDIPGVAYITAVDRENGLAAKSNPIGIDFSKKENIYFGDIHGQVYESIGTGTIDEYFEWGRDAECVDFCSMANHYRGRYDITEKRWQSLVEKANFYNDPGKFVTFVSFEWGNRFGHKNIYYKANEGKFIPWWREQDNPNQLFNLLKGQKQEVLVIPHHSKYCTVTDWNFRDNRFQRLVEVCSGWGVSECGGGNSIQRALSMGHRLGFIGGTDTHTGQPGHSPYGPREKGGLAAVYAPELTRKSLFNALYNRHCYATSGARILLDFQIDESKMGSEISFSSANFKKRNIFINVAGTSRIERIELIRNNQVIFMHQPHKWVTQAKWTDEEPLEKLLFTPKFSDDAPFCFYYCRITQEDGYKAWSSPIWFEKDRP